MSKTVFISKNPSEINELDKVIAGKGDALVCQSFLSYEAVDFDVDHDYQCVFFSSPRSVIFYLKGNSVSPNSAVASVGKKTSALLKQLGYTIDFDGDDYTGSIEEVAQAFHAWSTGKKILFPISNISNRTFSSLLEDALKKEVVVYKTIIEDHTVSVADIYVFTSPSNVKGFLANNQLPKEANVVAWGTTTQKALIDHSIHVTHTLERPTFESLIVYLYA